MKIVEQPKKREIENILPLVNVVFLLLIFFMVAGSFTSPELYKVDLPESESRLTADVHELKILLDSYGNFALNDQSITLDSLAHTINSMTVTSAPVMEIQLKADADADALQIVELVDHLKNTDIEILQIITQ